MEDYADSMRLLAERKKEQAQNYADNAIEYHDYRQHQKREGDDDDDYSFWDILKELVGY